MNYGLPRAVDIDGEQFAIRYDFRAILDIFEAFNDPKLDEVDRASVMLQIFYVEPERITNFSNAIAECIKFLNGGKLESHKDKSKTPRLVDWKKDFQYIVGPINRILGYEIREKEYDPISNTGGVHWYTFLSAYAEIGDCLFSQIVRIRNKKAIGRPLDKSDAEFYRKNRDLVDFETSYTDSDNEILEHWGVR